MVFYEFDDSLFYWKVNVFKPKHMSESSEVNGPGTEKPEQRLYMRGLDIRSFHIKILCRQ